MMQQDLIHGLLKNQFSSETRLYELKLHQLASSDTALDSGDLLVEGFTATESLHTYSEHNIIVLSTSAHLDLHSLINQAASLQVSLSDATRTQFSGVINHVALLGSEGGFARYRIRMVSWPWLLTQQRNSRVWQEQTVQEIINSIFAQYAGHADWAWSEEVSAFMADARPRSYCVQYRETDFDFVRRLLTEEGLSYRIEEVIPDDTADGSSTSNNTGQHRLVIFADTSQLDIIPEDATSASALGGMGIRFHGGRSREEQDSIQMLSAKRQLNVAKTSVLSFDYKAKQAVAASVNTHHTIGGEQAPAIESYDATGIYTYANSGEAARYAKLHQQTHEARNKLWQARSTVRTLRPGTRFNLTQAPTDKIDGQDFVVTQVHSIGINNLPKPAVESLAELFGDIPTLLSQQLQQLEYAALQANTRHSQQQLTQLLGIDHSKAAASLTQPNIELAQQLGYANAFEAIRADIPWRPLLDNQIGAYHNPKPTVLGSQSAVVVGASGANDDEEAHDNGGDEIYTDKLGRIKIRFHWQGGSMMQGADAGQATCWVRVAQRSAGNGMGVQFLPRIGQEVQVQFIEGDIDRPIVIGALYNGQGEGGISPTPGGDNRNQADVTVYEQATDHSMSAQGNLIGGNSPAWHGGSGDSKGHNNPTALTGIRTKEFSGFGYNQLQFDDTDAQGRVSLSTTQYGSQLNLGHLIHTADNYRGSFRGQGAELRTDAYGALRAGAGYLITSFPLNHGAETRDPAADNVAGMAHLKQATTLASTLNKAAQIHQTVQFSSHIGADAANKSNIASQGSNKPAAPLKALHTAASGMVTNTLLGTAYDDAAQQNTKPAADALPHSTDPLIHMVGKSGLNYTAGQHLQWANQETATIMSGQDSQWMTGEQFRLHTGQTIGMLGGAINPGKQGLGLQLITAKDNTDIQAQSDSITLQAKKNINVMSANSHIDWAAAKSITLSTAGGANITIAGGNITVQCPGQINIHASKKSFEGPTRLNYKLPLMPDAFMNPVKRKMRFALGALPNHMSNYGGEPYTLYADGGQIAKGIADDDGAVVWEHIEGTKTYTVELVTGQTFDVKVLDQFSADSTKHEKEILANQGYPSFIHEAAVKAPHGAENDEFRILHHKNDNNIIE